MSCQINAISYYLPEAILTNDELSSKFPEWSVEKISNKTGIRERHIAAADEFTSDMAVKAANKLFTEHNISPLDIDFILLCTQTPDYYLPTTACLVQTQLGIPTSAGALDFNLGCSGYVYGLGLAKGLLATGQAKNLLLITSETYSKHINEGDKSVRTIFGDGAAATYITQSDTEKIGNFVYGSDGKGAENLIVRDGSIRERNNPEGLLVTTSDDNGNTRTRGNLYMNGGEIFIFTLKNIPDLMQQVLVKNNLTLDDVDMVVLHQANQYMLESIRKKGHIPQEKFFVSMAHAGNTVSSTIPIAIYDGLKNGTIKKGQTLLVAGFGVGYSWAASIIKI